jgi:hypothetical protein
MDKLDKLHSKAKKSGAKARKDMNNQKLREEHNRNVENLDREFRKKHGH